MFPCLLRARSEPVSLLTALSDDWRCSDHPSCIIYPTKRKQKTNSEKPRCIPSLFIFSAAPDVTKGFTSPREPPAQRPGLPCYFRRCFFSHYWFFFQAWHKILKSFTAFSSLICSDSFFEDRSASRWFPAPLLSQAVFPFLLIAFCTHSTHGPTLLPAPRPRLPLAGEGPVFTYLGVQQATAPPSLQPAVRAAVLQPHTRNTELVVTGWQGAGCPGHW